jgi:hypothetical protein
MKIAVNLGDFNQTSIFPVRYSKKFQTSKLMKIRTFGADLFPEERGT